MSTTHVYSFRSCNTHVYGFGYAVFKEIITGIEKFQSKGAIMMENF